MTDRHGRAAAQPPSSTDGLLHKITPTYMTLGTNIITLIFVLKFTKLVQTFTQFSSALDV